MQKFFPNKSDIFEHIFYKWSYPLKNQWPVRIEKNLFKLTLMFEFYYFTVKWNLLKKLQVLGEL